jgi:hypothetical protein
MEIPDSLKAKKVSVADSNTLFLGLEVQDDISARL